MQSTRGKGRRSEKGIMLKKRKRRRKRGADINEKTRKMVPTRGEGGGGR